MHTGGLCRTVLWLWAAVHCPSVDMRLGTAPSSTSRSGTPTQVQHDPHRRVALCRLHMHAELPQPRPQRAPPPAKLDKPAVATTACVRDRRLLLTSLRRVDEEPEPSPGLLTAFEQRR